MDIKAPAQPAAGIAEEATLRWLRRTYGLSAAGAARRLEQEQRRTQLAGRLTALLGARSGGAWLDARSGRLVVGVLDRAAAARVRAAGARPVPVGRSAAALEQVRRRLDADARSHGPGRAVSWFVDLPSNAVVVEVRGGRSGLRDAATRRLVAAGRTSGDSRTVRVVPAAGGASVQAGMYGGRQVEADERRRCSAGFTAKDSAGRHVVLTAGHCTTGSSRLYSHGVLIGKVRGTSFPGNDYGAVNIDNARTWIPEPWVDRYDGYAIAVKGWSRAPVGAAVCKSGRTTGWTCGKVRAHDVTVAYDRNKTVSGLTRTSACTREGDSGGPFMQGRYAQGMVSGGITLRGRCLQDYHSESISFFQPVDEALDRLGLRLLTRP